MLVQESLVGEALHPKAMYDTTHESDDEETLSLCDLPLYSDQSVELERDLSLDSHTSSNNTSISDDYFEFFSQELNPSAAAAAAAAGGFPPETIIFCGKFIPYKQHSTSQNDYSSSSSSLEIDNSKKKPIIIKSSLFRWKLSYFGIRSKNGARGTTHMQQSPKKTYNTKKHKRGLGFPMHHKVPVFTSSSSGIAKWYLFLFGITRFSTEVELRDIKRRRSRRRRHCSSPPSPPPPMFGFENRDNEVSGGRNNRGWGWWGLMIRALSCGGNNQPTTVAAASMGCTTPEHAPI